MATFSGVGGTAQLLAAADEARLAISGAQYSSVIWVVQTAGSGGITAEYSKDGGINWLVPALTTRMDAVSANPSTAQWANNGPVAGTYETPLPANAVEVLTEWVKAGAAIPDDIAKNPTLDPKQHWAYQPVREPAAQQSCVWTGAPSSLLKPAFATRSRRRWVSRRGTKPNL